MNSIIGNNGRQGLYDGEEQQHEDPCSVSCQGGVVEREHMFDKVVTPSDVGKLNRLVIPKQHAERYFPLDSSTKDKGLLLNFEDKNGKPWRFRYSYWNSSQSYVMTKGWSRFVKQHKLDAGDIVSFHRGVGVGDDNRLFIDWRRAPPHPQLLPTTYTNFPHQHFNFSMHPNPWNPIFLQQNERGGGGGGGGGRYRSDHLHLTQSTSYGGPPPNYGYTTITTTTPCSESVICFRSESTSASASAPQQHLGMQVQIQQTGILSSTQVQPPPPPPPVVFESVPVVQGKSAAAKRLRLFGVNMDYSSDSQEMPFPSTTTSSSSTSSSSSASTSTIPYLQLTPNYTPTPSSSNKAKASISMDLDI